MSDRPFTVAVNFLQLGQRGQPTCHSLCIIIPCIKEKARFCTIVFYLFLFIYMCVCVCVECKENVYVVCVASSSTHTHIYTETHKHTETHRNPHTETRGKKGEKTGKERDKK